MSKIQEQGSHVFRLCHDAIKINPGPPALYCLRTERTYIDENHKNIRRWTFGQKDNAKQNKIILMVGKTGSGKTTLINTLINHLLGVKFEDEIWYEITEENKEKAHISQTSEITVYEVFIEEKPTSLTIIDTPGYGNTKGIEKDAEIAEYLRRLFSDEDGIHYIDAVCFVMKASENRLTGEELYIFHSVLSLFGKDIENNIVFLLTHSDGLPPTDALNAIEKADIPCRRDEDNEPVYFLFNNRQKEKRDKHHKHAYRSAWEMGERSMHEFFKILEEKNRKSVQMTLDVLKERTRLDACVYNLRERITEKEKTMKELSQIQEALRQNRDKIKNCENFVITVEKGVKEKVLIENEWWWNSNATCCSVCEENCHVWSCWCANDPSKCEVMVKGFCTVCTGKCHHSKHVKENKKYEIRLKKIEMTFDALKKAYGDTSDPPKTSFDKNVFENTKKEHESNIKESEDKSRTEECLTRDLEKIESQKSILVHETYTIIISLCKIALKADSASTLQHLDFLIPRLKEEKGKEEWVKKLEDLKKAGEEQKNNGAVRHVMNKFLASFGLSTCQTE